MWINLSHIYTHLKCKMRQKFHPFCRYIADLTTVTVYGRFLRENGVIEYILSSYIKSPLMCRLNLLNNRAII